MKTPRIFFRWNGQRRAQRRGRVILGTTYEPRPRVNVYARTFRKIETLAARLGVTKEQALERVLRGVRV